ERRSWGLRRGTWWSALIRPIPGKAKHGTRRPVSGISHLRRCTQARGRACARMVGEVVEDMPKRKNVRPFHVPEGLSCVRRVRTHVSTNFSLSAKRRMEAVGSFFFNKNKGNNWK